MNKLLYIGFDALDHYWVTKYLDSMPTFKRLIDSGCLGLMEPEYPITGCSWSTLHTGLLKENHGITDQFGRPVDGSKTFADVDPNLYIWNHLAKAGYRVGCLNLPITHPPKAPSNGWMISGFPTPKKSPKKADPISIQAKWMDTYYVDVVQYYIDKMGGDDFPQNRQWHHQMRKMGIPHFLAINRELESARLQLAKKIIKKYPVNVLMYANTFVDRYGHYFKYDNKSDDKMVYSLADEILKYTLDLYKAENIVVVSDHGLRGTDHTYSGTCIFYGHAFKNGYEFTCSNTDVMPTILSLCRIGVPDVDGVVLKEVFQDGT